MTVPDFPCLVVANGLKKGRALAIYGAAGERTIGSGAGADLELEAGSVARLHARLRWRERGVFVEDAGSDSGSFVNGERIASATQVADGDRVWLGPPGETGSVRLLVRLPGPPGDYAAPDPALLVDETLADAPESEWGAVDDDGRLMSSETPETTPAPEIEAEAAAEPEAAPGFEPEPSAEEPQPAPGVVAPRRPAPRLTRRPPARRTALVALGALAVGIAGYMAYSRWDAPAPVLLELLPPKAEPGQTIQINGSGFEAKPEDNQVLVADTPAQVIAAAPTQLSVVVPSGLAADDKPQHRVRITARGTPSNTLFFRVYVSPKVTAFEPDVAMPGDEVRALGEHFGDDTTVAVGGLPAEILSVQPDQLRFKVPEVSVQQGRSLPVGVQVGRNSARLVNLLIGKLPLLLEVVPTRGRPGERVILKGRGFDPAPGATWVGFGERSALVIAASQNELTLAVPGAGSLTGPAEVEIKVRVGGIDSSTTLPFVVVRVSAAAFVPRFVPEPGPDPDTVLVSSELGPFLRLAGSGDAQSAAERGGRAAAALNDAMEQALRGPLALELREQPEPALWLAGRPAPLLVARPEDGFAYGALRPSARALARFWLALLQDYVALFAHKERPVRVLELSPRGQLLLELFVAAERRAGAGAGVPPSLIAELTQAQSQALAEMALAVPAEGQAVSGAAVAGRWEGTLQETGQAARPIQVRLAVHGGELAGSLTTRVGAVAAELALEGPAYRNGTLEFVVKLGAAPLHFGGVLRGRNLEGQLKGPDGKPVGRFALRWVE